jgi:glucose/arabinose dehydrogenase/mono/diheme cytochrome c family protein
MGRDGHTDVRVSTRSSFRLLALALLAALWGPGLSSAQALTRVANETLSVPPEPPGSTYAVQEAFGALNFTRPVCIVTPPGETNRIFILEKQGIISVITNLSAPNRTVFMNIDARVTGGLDDSSEQGLLGLAFHPEYASNGFFYVFYTGPATTGAGTGTHDILSRFSVMPGNANQGNPGSELILMAQFDQANNHNGGDLHFGPDRYLYVSLGDEGNANDSFANSQRIDKDLFSGILRIDVDKRGGNLLSNGHPATTTNYFIPADNPFVGATSFNGLPVNPANVLGEFWAVGLRNPWRMSFDPATGDLYTGDVGQNAREEIDLIVKGGNFGWNYREGTIPRPGSGAPPAGFSAIEPLMDYTRGSGVNQGNVVIGGLVYRGTRISQLYGAYVFADAGSGNVWAIRHDGLTTNDWQRLLASQFGLSAFGTDPRNGDILWAAQTAGRIRRLLPATSTGTPLPPTLAETGVFSSLPDLTPHPGIVPYALNVPFWSDNAIKSRWFSIPNTNLTMTFSADGNWTFPTGSVWIKHFDLELTHGVPESRRRLETRLLVKNEQGVHGFTYRWGNSTANATLVAAEGLDESFVINEGGVLRTQVWHYPSRSECLACHTPAGGHVLGFNTAQLNRSHDLGEGPENQVAAVSAAGYFNSSVSNFNLLSAMPALNDEDVSREQRVRAWLAANCVSCHGPNANAPALWDARFATPTAQAGLLEGALVNNGGNASNRVIARGSAELSMILQRISKRGPGQMPPLASTVVDTQAVALVSLWITNDLPWHETFAEWQIAQFGSTNAPGAGWDEDLDDDGDNAYLEYLNGTNPKLASSRWQISYLTLGSMFYTLFNRAANRGYELQFTDNLADPGAWQPSDSPWNTPQFFSGDSVWFVPDAIEPTQDRLYRVRVYER